MLLALLAVLDVPVHAALDQLFNEARVAPAEYAGGSCAHQLLDQLGVQRLHLQGEAGEWRHACGIVIRFHHEQRITRLYVMFNHNV
jgi:uncharacterized protein YgbK (DUF1537 family)